MAIKLGQEEVTVTANRIWDDVQPLTSPNKLEAPTTTGVANPAVSQPRSQLVLLVSGLLLLAILLVEFVGGFFIQQRAQVQLRNEFTKTLTTAASAFGQPDLSPLPDTAPRLGSAVAQVSIPSIGLSQIAIEGSTPEYTRQGVAHVPGTVLPGQAGHSMIIGRRTSFGAPLAGLGNVAAGSEILVTTIEGIAKYKVIPNSTPEDELPANLLTIVTANPPVLSISQLSVQAELVGKPFPATPRNNPMSTRSDHLAEFIVLLQLLIASIVAIPFMRKRFSAMITWLVLAPVVGALIVGLALVVDTYFPATL